MMTKTKNPIDFIKSAHKIYHIFSLLINTKRRMSRPWEIMLFNEEHGKIEVEVLGIEGKKKNLIKITDKRKSNLWE